MPSLASMSIHTKLYMLAGLSVIACVLFIIAPTRRWLIKRFRTFDYAADYFKAALGHFGDVFWGAAVGAGIGSILGVSVPFLILALYSQFQTPPRFLNWLAILFAVILAGYYVWRADHVRLTPKLGISLERHLQETPVEQGKERRVFVQIEPTCLSDAPITECQGHLLRVYNRWAKEAWSLTEMRERLLLEWSHYGAAPITLYPSGGQYLNVCWRQNSIRILIPCSSPVPSRWREEFDNVGTYRFDIEITAKDCPPVQVSVTVNIDETNWNKPEVAVTPGWKGTNEQ